ncbi:hypothetical protein [Novipirellula rosea]|uniref:Uncharacterized protein n=1 Tax=Novipirellula rosea TaxID=1031540 RepID=A0ABP8NF87_9BACT
MIDPTPPKDNYGPSPMMSTIEMIREAQRLYRASEAQYASGAIVSSGFNYGSARADDATFRKRLGPSR